MLVATEGQLEAPFFRFKRVFYLDIWHSSKMARHSQAHNEHNGRDRLGWRGGKIAPHLGGGSDAHTLVHFCSFLRRRVDGIRNAPLAKNAALRDQLLSFLHCALKVPNSCKTTWGRANLDEI